MVGNIQNRNIEYNILHTYRQSKQVMQNDGDTGYAAGQKMIGDQKKITGDGGDESTAYNHGVL